VTLYRGVYPVAFDVTDKDPQAFYYSVFRLLLDLKLVNEGEFIILTKGELTGVAGGTNSMKILQVNRH
jgi:pyruvate kinase